MLVTASQPQTVDNARRNRAHIAIGDHGAFGLAGGARGIDHQPYVAQQLASQRLFNHRSLGRISLGARKLQLLEGEYEFSLRARLADRSDEHPSDLQSIMRIS